MLLNFLHCVEFSILAPCACMEQYQTGDTECDRRRFVQQKHQQHHILQIGTQSITLY